MDEKGILKNSEYKNFTAVPNVLINNISMSCQARFLYIYMLSKPNNWKFYLNDLSKSLGMSIDTLRKYMKELIEQGWITRNKQEHDEISKKFDAVSYKVNFPCREKAVSEKFRYGKNSTLNNKDNKQKNKENKNNNNISIDEDFEIFWKLYDKKNDKVAAKRAWNKLSKEDRAAAIAGIKPYQEAMRFDKQFIRYPSTYLNKRTWEDDFSDYTGKTFYEIREDDTEKEKRFKEHMRKKHPAIEQVRNPLTMCAYIDLANAYGSESVEQELTKIENNIALYKLSDISYEIAKSLEKGRI